MLSVREDGKLNLSLREKAYLQMDVDSAKILEKLKRMTDSFHITINLRLKISEANLE